MSKIIKYKNTTILYHRHHRNNASAVAFGLNVGGFSEKKGLVHFVEHCLMGHGTKTMTSEECKAFSTEHIPTLNAVTTKDSILVTFYESSRDLEDNIKFCADKFFNSASTSVEIENEKKVIANEIKRSEQNNQIILYYTDFNLINDTPLDMFHVVGTEKSIKDLSQRSIDNFRKKYYTKQNFIFSIATNKSLRFVKKLVNKYFLPYLKDCDESNVKHFPYSSEKRKSATKTIEKGDTKLCTILITKLAPAYSKQTLPKSKITMQCIYRPRGRLFQKFRIENPITYETPYFNFYRHNTYSKLQLRINVLPENINKAFELASEVYTDLHKNGITQEEFDAYKRLKLRKKDVAVKGPIKGIAEDNFDEFIERGEFFLNKDFQKLEKKETFESINAYSKEIFTPNKLFVTILGNFDKKKIYSFSKIKKMFNVSD